MMKSDRYRNNKMIDNYSGKLKSNMITNFILLTIIFDNNPALTMEIIFCGYAKRCRCFVSISFSDFPV